MKQSKLAVAFAGTLILAGIAVAQAPPTDPSKMDHSKMDHSKMGKPMPADASAATKAFIEANAKMHKDMTMEFTGNADKDFIKGMLPHHQGAVDMARIVIQYGKDPEVRKLAEAIIKAQNEEIDWMKGWLAKSGK